MPWKIWKIPYALQKKSDGVCGEWVSVLFLVTHDGWQHSPCSHRHMPLETVFSTAACAWRPSCSWNYSCLWFWHTALRTAWCFCSAFVTSSPLTTHYLASFPLCSPCTSPTILSIMTKVSTMDMDLGCAPQLLHLTPITSLNTECECLCLDIFAHRVPKQGVMPDTWVWRSQAALMLWLNGHPMQMVQLVSVWIITPEATLTPHGASVPYRQPA